MLWNEIIFCLRNSINLNLEFEIFLDIITYKTRKLFKYLSNFIFRLIIPIPCGNLVKRKCIAIISRFKDKYKNDIRILMEEQISEEYSDKGASSFDQR